MAQAALTAGRGVKPGMRGAGLAFVLASMALVGGCDGRTEAEPAAPEGRPGSAFEEKLEGCAAVAETFGGAWVGKPYAEFETWLAGHPSSELGDLRVIRPGTMVTKDYRPDRLNIMLDDADVVTKFYCG
jgi:hypothetical protein